MGRGKSGVYTVECYAWFRASTGVSEGTLQIGGITTPPHMTMALRFPLWYCCRHMSLKTIFHFQGKSLKATG